MDSSWRFLKSFMAFRGFGNLMKSGVPPKFAAVIVMILVFQLMPTMSRAGTRDAALEKVIRISGLRGQIQSMPASFLMTIPSDMFSTIANAHGFTLESKMRSQPKVFSKFSRKLSMKISIRKISTRFCSFMNQAWAEGSATFKAKRCRQT